jgi:hypothetical protein
MSLIATQSVLALAAAPSVMLRGWFGLLSGRHIGGFRWAHTSQSHRHLKSHRNYILLYLAANIAKGAIPFHREQRALWNSSALRA